MLQDHYLYRGRRIPAAQFVTREDVARAHRAEARGLGCAEVAIADLLLARVERLIEAGAK